MKKQLLNALSKTINQYFNLDSASKKRLHALRGKIITIELLPMHMTFHCVFTDDGLELHSNTTSAADTIIRGTPIQFANLMLSKDKRHFFFADDIQIEGSAELGQYMMNLFSHLQIDWEEYLSEWVGDISTHHFARFTQAAQKQWRHTKESLTRNIDDYLHEEKDLFPPQEALNDFFSEIDTLRMDVDRLAAKIQGIQNEIDNTNLPPDSH